MTIYAALTVGLLLCLGPAAAWYFERVAKRETPAPATLVAMYDQAHANGGLTMPEGRAATWLTAAVAVLREVAERGL